MHEGFQLGAVQSFLQTSGGVDLAAAMQLHVS